MVTAPASLAYHIRLVITNYRTSFSYTMPLLQAHSGGKTSRYLMDAFQRRQISMVEGGWSYRADAKEVRVIIKRRCEVSDPFNTESDSSARQHDKETHHAYLRRDAGAYIDAGHLCQLRSIATCCTDSDGVSHTAYKHQSYSTRVTKRVQPIINPHP